MSSLDEEGKKNYIISQSKNLHKYEQIQIFKICRKYNVKFSENSNGIFINLNYLPSVIINQIVIFIEFCIKNKSLLDREIYKREELKKILSLNKIITQNQQETNVVHEDSKIHYEKGFSYQESNQIDNENYYQEKNVVVPTLE